MESAGHSADPELLDRVMELFAKAADPVRGNLLSSLLLLLVVVVVVVVVAVAVLVVLVLVLVLVLVDVNLSCSVFSLL